MYLNIEYTTNRKRKRDELRDVLEYEIRGNLLIVKAVGGFEYWYNMRYVLKISTV